MAFNTTRRETLSRIADTLAPALPPEEGDDPRLFDTSASHLRVPAEMTATLEERLEPARQKRLGWFLWALERGVFNGLTAGRWRAFSRLDREGRTAVLWSWATSSLSPGRALFQGLKRLVLFLFYSIEPDEGENPTWPALGYPGPPGQRATGPPDVQPLSDVPATLDCDVLVVGSGAGGGVVAGELARAGLEVIVAEKGEYVPEAEMRGAEREATERMFEGGGGFATVDSSVVILAGSTLGGGTTVNWMTCLRPPERLLHEWEHEHGFTGAAGPEMQESLDEVERRIHVTLDESEANGQNVALVRGCDERGLPSRVTPRNARDCQDCSFCTFGCPYGAKQSTVKTYLRDACEHGARVLVRAEVERVTHEGGRATGAVVTVRQDGGVPQAVTVRARAVVVAAGALHTPALLKRSGLTHPAIGDHLHLQPGTASFAIYPEPITPWLGAPQTRFCDALTDLDGHGHGVMIETASAHPGIAALASPWRSGRQHKRLLGQFEHIANFMTIVRDRHTGRVDVGRDGRPEVHYSLHDDDAAHLMRGLHETLRLHRAAGAHTLLSPHSRYLEHRVGSEDDLERYLREVAAAGFEPNAFALFSAHQMSSCRISGDRGRGAVKPDGETYEIDNLFVADASVFPSASGVNPMLPVMGVAHYLARQMRARLT